MTGCYQRIILIPRPDYASRHCKFSLNAFYRRQIFALDSIVVKTQSLIEVLTLKAPITTAADDKFCDNFSNFPQK